MLCLFLQIVGRIKIMSSHFCKNTKKKRKKQVNNGVGRSCACSLVLGLKSPKAKNVLFDSGATGAVYYSRVSVTRTPVSAATVITTTTTTTTEKVELPSQQVIYLRLVYGF